jgi:ubiquinone/menaquinone biosynthesis C-methylase UbiE
MNENEVREFWNAHPCGEELVGGVKDDLEEFYTRYDKFRYTREGHILKCLDAIDFKGKRVLEIGLGLGADSEQIIRRGAIWSGLDLTPESIARLAARFQLRNLPYENLKVGSVRELPFDSDTFDIVFSHGVLHHVPQIEKAQAEIARVLKPGGQLIVMLYAKYSLNYLVSIAVVRRLALLFLYVSGIRPKGMVGQHLINLRETGTLRYLRMRNFIHHNTDGPLSPYSKVYDLAEVRKDFKNFRVVKCYKEFMHAPPLPVSWLPLSRQLGWHLWVHMEPIKSVL